jgi:hypothetical protein
MNFHRVRIGLAAAGLLISLVAKADLTHVSSTVVAAAPKQENVRVATYVPDSLTGPATLAHSAMPLITDGPVTQPVILVVLGLGLVGLGITQRRRSL